MRGIAGVVHPSLPAHHRRTAVPNCQPTPTLPASVQPPCTAHVMHDHTAGDITDWEEMSGGGWTQAPRVCQGSAAQSEQCPMLNSLVLGCAWGAQHHHGVQTDLPCGANQNETHKGHLHDSLNAITQADSTIAHLARMYVTIVLQAHTSRRRAAPLPCAQPGPA